MTNFSPSSDELLKDIQAWLESEGHDRLPSEVDLTTENGGYTIQLENEFRPTEFAEMLNEKDDLHADWVDRENGVIGVMKEESLGSGVLNRAAYGTTFHKGKEVPLSNNGSPMTQSGEPIDSSTEATLELISMYLNYS